MINLGLVVGSTLFTFVVLEIAARIYLLNFAPDTFFNKYASIDQLNERYGAPAFSAHRYLGYFPTPNYTVGMNRHNSLGYRGEEVTIPKPEGVFRIVCMGGSTTYSIEVKNYRQTYPYLLQRDLQQAGYENVEVVNAGVSGYSSADSLVNFEFRLLDLEPDLIIVYDNVNDIPPRMIWPPELFMGDASYFETRLFAFVPSFWERSTLLRMLLVRAGWAEPHDSLRRNFHESTEFSYNGLFSAQMQKGIYPDGFFQEVSIQQMLETNAPVYFERNLRNLVALAEAHGVQVVLLTFGYTFERPDVPNLISPEYEFGYLQHNDIIRQIAATTNAYLYDFWAEMPKDAAYFTDGIHFSIRGEQVHARLIAEYLIENQLVPGGGD